MAEPITLTATLEEVSGKKASGEVQTIPSRRFLRYDAGGIDQLAAAGFEWRDSVTLEVKPSNSLDSAQYLKGFVAKSGADLMLFVGDEGPLYELPLGPVTVTVTKYEMTAEGLTAKLG